MYRPELRHFLSVTLLAVTFALMPRVAAATDVMELSDDDLVAISSRIVEGNVVSAISQWNPPHDDIFTVVTISVIQMIKGTPPPSGLVVLQQMGGEVDNMVAELVGQPTFVPGEHVIVFIDDASPPLMRLTGLEQGKVTIVPSPITGMPTVQERGVPRDAFVRDISRKVVEQGRR